MRPPLGSFGSESNRGAGSESNRSGMSHDDHHFAKPSPPATHAALYDYLPCVQERGSAKRVPKRVTLATEMLGLAEDLQSRKQAFMQTKILGTYNLTPLTASGKPVWKHSREDLVLAAGTVDGEPGWVVALGSVFGIHDKVAARIGGEAFPFSPAQKTGRNTKPAPSAWQVWNGRKWIHEPTLRARPSYHGWGVTSVADRPDEQFSTTVKFDRYEERRASHFTIGGKQMLSLLESKLSSKDKPMEGEEGSGEKRRKK